MTADPYHFPFIDVTKDDLKPDENYYIQLDDRVITKFIERGHKLPVSKLKGKFVRLEKIDNIAQTPTEYAVFKDVYIMNRNYKPGFCRMMQVKYPEGFIANAGEGCESYSDSKKNRIVNQDREVYFQVSLWQFGISREHSNLKRQITMNSTPSLPSEIISTIHKYGGNNTRKFRKQCKKTKRRRNKKCKKTKRKY